MSRPGQAIRPRSLPSRRQCSRTIAVSKRTVVTRQLLCICQATLDLRSCQDLHWERSGRMSLGITANLEGLQPDSRLPALVPNYCEARERVILDGRTKGDS